MYCERQKYPPTFLQFSHTISSGMNKEESFLEKCGQIVSNTGLHVQNMIDTEMKNDTSPKLQGFHYAKNFGT